MENRLKCGYQLLARKNDKGKLIGTFVKYQSPYCISDIFESPIIDNYLNYLSHIKQEISYGKRLAFRYDLNTFTYQVAIEKELREGPYGEAILWETIKEEQDLELACAIQKLEDSLQVLHTSTKQLSLSNDLDQKLLCGYQLSIQTNIYGELIGGLLLIEDNQYKEYQQLEEKQLLFMEQMQPLVSQIQKGKVVTIIYDQNDGCYQAQLKEKKLYEFQKGPLWKVVNHSKSENSLNAMIQLNQAIEIKKEGKKVYEKR